MPLYTVIAREHSLSDEIKRKDGCRNHADPCHGDAKVPPNFVRVVFLSYPLVVRGYAAGVEAPIAAVNCVLRSGHSAADKEGYAPSSSGASRRFKT